MPKRVSQRLLDLVPKIAEAGFAEVEVFEPHIDLEALEEIRQSFGAHSVRPTVLSSYLDLAALAEEAIPAAVDELKVKTGALGFRKIRLFPGPKISPADGEGVTIFEERLFRLATELGPVEVLLETHDGSIADDPRRVLDIVSRYKGKNIGLLYQPTVFKEPEAWEQFEMQKAFIRHVHLQDRDANRKIVFPNDGILPWQRILGEFAGDVTIEFLPAGMLPEEEFSLAATLDEARRVRAFIEKVQRCAHE